MGEKRLQYLIRDDDQGKRLDLFLNGQQTEMSRSFIQKHIKEQRVLVNGKPSKSGYRLTTGDQVTLEMIPIQEPEILPENIPLDILYEDADIIVVNKPKQMVLHPAPGHYTGTLVNALLYHCRDSLSGINGVLRPGIVHRIDQDTTGVVVACKNDQAHRALAEQLKVHSITRIYHAIVWHHIKEDGTVDKPLGRHPVDRKKRAVVANGREAVTHYHVLDELDRGYTYISCQLETGRTHQIRVHMASIGHPILGDTVYGPDKQPFHLTGQTLHAKTLGFLHPVTGEYMEFEAPLPDYFQKLLDILSK